MSYDGLEWVLMQSVLTHITSFELKLSYTLAINLELEGGRCNARQKSRRLAAQEVLLTSASHGVYFMGKMGRMGKMGKFPSSVSVTHHPHQAKRSHLSQPLPPSISKKTNFLLEGVRFGLSQKWAPEDSTRSTAWQRARNLWVEGCRCGLDKEIALDG